MACVRFYCPHRLCCDVHLITRGSLERTYNPTRCSDGIHCPLCRYCHNGCNRMAVYVFWKNSVTRRLSFGCVYTTINIDNTTMTLTMNIHFNVRIPLTNLQLRYNSINRTNTTMMMISFIIGLLQIIRKKIQDLFCFIQF